MKLMSVAGARPNFIKLAAIARAVEKFNKARVESAEAIKHVIVHTGQHYDEKMSKSFFSELAIPKPDINLEVGSGSHAVQTAEIMRRFEPVLLAEQPDVLLVVGDVNSTIACTLVASKVEYPKRASRKRPVIVHVEAGLRSFDPDMPEEVNRVLTDRLSDFLFVTEESGLRNLRQEGVTEDKIHFVGNVMIDTLQHHLAKARNSLVHTRFDLPQQYGVVTLHRPSNVDALENIEPLLHALTEISTTIPLIFPIHPRTLSRVQEFGLDSLFNWSKYPNAEKNSDNHPSFPCQMYIIPPLGYLDFLQLVSKSTLVVTDSGGIQEETTYLGIPCVTLRHNTERPVTVDVGSNYLIGTKPEDILHIARVILDGGAKKAAIPDLWDGRAGDRIVNIIAHDVIG